MDAAEVDELTARVAVRLAPSLEPIRAEIEYVRRDLSEIVAHFRDTPDGTPSLPARLSTVEAVTLRNQQRIDEIDRSDVVARAERVRGVWLAIAAGITAAGAAFTGLWTAFHGHH